MSDKTAVTVPYGPSLDKGSVRSYTGTAMKASIHPTYVHTAVVTCACGHTFTTGSTVPDIRVEVCSNCHPFYTGKQNLVDTAGRVDRFKKIMEKSDRGGRPLRTKRAKLEAKKARKVAKATKEE